MTSTHISTSAARLVELRRERDRLLRERNLAVNALRKIAVFNDVLGTAAQPTAVKAARATLKKLGITS